MKYLKPNKYTKTFSIVLFGNNIIQDDPFFLGPFLPFRRRLFREPNPDLKIPEGGRTTSGENY